MNQNALKKVVDNEDTTDENLSVPHNTEIEAALLSALILDNRKCELVAETLRPEHFYAPHNARIYEIITAMVDGGQVVTASTLKHLFPSEPLLADGGLEYLAELVTNTNPLMTASAEYYANTICDLFQKRELISLGEHVVRDAYDLGDLENTATKQIESAEEKLYNLAERGDAIRTTISLKDSLKSVLATTAKAMERDSHIVGVTTGFADIDRWLGGLHNSDLLILAGRPSMGKTALATNIAFNAANAFRAGGDDKKAAEGAQVLFFSLEMSSDQLSLRIIAEQSSVRSDKMRTGMIKQEDLENVTHASHRISEIPLYIDDTPALTVSGLRQRARRWKRSKGLDLIVIDYLQLLQGSSGKRYDNRVLELSDITRSLKGIAKELDVPILALSQLSRQVEHREDKRPQLADLRESGTIEQDADVVMFLFREEYYLQRSTPMMKEGMSEAKLMELEAEYTQRLESVRNKAQVIIAKQRHGAVGSVDLHFDAEFTRFSDLAQEQDF